MKTLTKKLGKGEIKWRGVVIPRAKTNLFPPKGVEFELVDGKSKHRVKMDAQSRLRMPGWFRQHKTVKPGDEIVFNKQDGTWTVSLSRLFSTPDEQILDWASEAIEAIKNGEIFGIIRFGGGKFSLEIGNHVKKTEISLEPK
jgi:hypothetical protein